MNEVRDACRRIADRAADLVYRHFAAIGFYNVGRDLKFRMGGFTSEAIANLRRRICVLGRLSASPFGDYGTSSPHFLLTVRSQPARDVFAVDRFVAPIPWARPTR